MGDQQVLNQWLEEDTSPYDARKGCALELGKKVGVIAEVDRGPLTFSGNGC